LKTFDQAAPLPSSSSPFVKTPTKVDLPESTFPITAILMSFSDELSAEEDPSTCLEASSGMIFFSSSI